MDLNQFNKGVGFEDEIISSQKDIHVRVQQRNRRQSITTVEGLEGILPEDVSFMNKLAKVFRKKFSCSAVVKKDKNGNSRVIQLQGDQRDGVRSYLVDNELAREEEIKIHGI